MKKALYLFLMLIIVLDVNAQNTKIDSLKSVISHIKSGNGRISAILQLGGIYSDRHDDSAVMYFEEAIRLSEKSGDTQNEIQARHEMAFYLYDVKADYVTALDLFLQNIKLEEQVQDTSHIFFDTRGTLFVYEAVGDYGKALEYVNRMRALVNSDIVKDKASLATYKKIVNYRSGIVFQELNKPDSAKPYFLRTYNNGVLNKELIWVALGSFALGDIYSGENRVDSTLYYYHISMRAALKMDRIDLYDGSIYSLAVFCWNNKKIDSALFYAKQCYKSAKKNQENDLVIPAASLLAQIYDLKKRPDSAYIYLSWSVHLKDSLLSAEKLFKLQNLTFDESIRQLEIATQKKQAEENHVRNLQLLAIGIFIPIFFLGVLFLSRTKVKPRVVEFLGILSLLLFFEFITDLIYPYVSQLTNENPIWEMLFLVLLAALMEPLNFKLEHWVKKHLVHKPVPVPLTVENSLYDVG